MYSTFMKSNDDTLDNGAYISLSQGTYSSIAALSKTKILASNVETDRFRWHAPHHNVVDGSGVKLRKGNATFYFASTADSSESTIFSELPLPLEGVLAPDIAFDTELARTEKRISELEAEQVQIRDMIAALQSLPPPKLSTIESLACGAIAGAVGKTVSAPIDRVKLLYMVNENRTLTYEKAMKTWKTITENTGMRGLWKGNASAMWRVLPYSATTFATFDKYKVMIANLIDAPAHLEHLQQQQLQQQQQQLLNGTSSVSSSSTSPPSPPSASYPILIRFVAGALAGCTATFLTYPFDLLRTRAAAHWHKQPLYATPLQGITAIYNAEGIRGLFKGINPTLIGIVPYGGISFATFETLKSAYVTYVMNGKLFSGILSLDGNNNNNNNNTATSNNNGSKSDTSNDTSSSSSSSSTRVKQDAQIPGLVRLFAGGMAGILSSTAVQPLHIVRRRMQVDVGDKPRYASTWEGLKTIYAKEGLRNGLFKGLTLTWVKGPISMAVSFAVNDWCKHNLREYHEQGQEQWVKGNVDMLSEGDRGIISMIETSKEYARQIKERKEQVGRWQWEGSSGAKDDDTQASLLTSQSNVGGPGVTGIGGAVGGSGSREEVDALSDASEKTEVLLPVFQAINDSYVVLDNRSRQTKGTHPHMTTSLHPASSLHTPSPPSSSTSPSSSSSSSSMEMNKLAVTCPIAPTWVSNTAPSSSPSFSPSLPPSPLPLSSPSSPSTIPSGNCTTAEMLNTLNQDLSQYNVSNESYIHKFLSTLVAWSRSFFPADPMLPSSPSTTPSSSSTPAPAHHHVIDPQTNTRRLSAEALLLAGGIAGACAKTVIAPADNVKILYQVNPHMLFSLRSALSTGITIVETAGVTGLWRGHTATLARVIPYASISFLTFDRYLELVNAGLYSNNFTSLGSTSLPSPSSTSPHASSSSSPSSSSSSHIPVLPSTLPHDALARFIAGGLAGATATAFTYPLDLMRARQAAHITSAPKYRSYIGGITEVARHEGVGALFSGLKPTLVGIVPYAGLSFSIFHTLKATARQSLNLKSDNDIPTSIRFASGAVAGLIAQSATYPLDIIRRRNQVGRMGPQSTMSALTSVYKSEGLVKGLFKGLSMNWIKGPIASAVSFTVNDRVKQYLATTSWA